MYDWLPAKTTKRKFDSGQLADRFVPSRRTMDYHEGRCFIYDNRSPLQESILPPRCYQKPHRKICCEPYETVVMESVPDDFYLDILDWSDYGWVAIGHGTSITLMNPTTRKERFKEAPYPTTYEIASSKPDRYGPSSVRFHRDKLAVGQKQGTLHIMDVPTMTWIQHTSPHAHCRIGALDWCDQNIVATGANDLKGTVLHDLRQKGPVAMMPHHEQICGLRWAPHRSDMLAVGTNDNLLKIWDIRKGVAAAFLHRAAVKAIAWSPKHSGVVGTGGGSNDQKVRFFDVRNNSLLHCVQTGSQVFTNTMLHVSRELDDVDKSYIVVKCMD